MHSPAGLTGILLDAPLVLPLRSELLKNVEEKKLLL
jgi:hypothetical protein